MEKNWHSLATIVVRLSLHGDHVDLVSIDEVYMEYINPFQLFFNSLKFHEVATYIRETPLVNGVN